MVTTAMTAAEMAVAAGSDSGRGGSVDGGSIYDDVSDNGGFGGSDGCGGGNSNIGSDDGGGDGRGEKTTIN